MLDWPHYFPDLATCSCPPLSQSSSRPAQLQEDLSAVPVAVYWQIIWFSEITKERYIDFIYGRARNRNYLDTCCLSAALECQHRVCFLNGKLTGSIGTLGQRGILYTIFRF